MNDEVFSGLTELLAAAVGLHEMYSAYKDAGFSEEQAFRLVQTIVASAGSRKPEGEL